MRLKPTILAPFALWAAVLAWPGAAGAAATTADAVVPGHPGVTYLALLRHLVPDLARTDPQAAGPAQIEGHLAKPLSHVAGADNGGDAPDPVVLGTVEMQRIKVGGRPRLLILADLGHSDDRVAGTSVLALFDDAPVPRLLDAVDVGMDRDTGFSERERLTLGPGDDAVVVYSEHFNSLQTYGFHTVVFARRDRLAMVAQVFTLSSRMCGWQRTEDPTFTVRPDPGRPYGQVSVAIRVAVTREPDEDCGQPVPRASARTWRGAWRWDGRRGRWAGGSAALDRLDKQNRADF